MEIKTGLTEESTTETRDGNEPSELYILASMPVFGAVPADALEFLLRRAERIEVPSGGYFFREGDPGETMYVLRRGRVKLTRGSDGRSEHLGHLGPGGCFGEMALLDLYPRSASVEAIEDSAALGISHGLLYELYGQAPEPFTIIIMNLARELSRRLRDADQRLARARGGWSAVYRLEVGEHRLPYI